MAGRRGITAERLTALGAERMAEILVTLAEEDRDIKRRLRLELAEQDGGDELAAEIGNGRAKLFTSIRIDVYSY